MSKAAQKNYVDVEGVPEKFGKEIYILAPLPATKLKQAMQDSMHDKTPEEAVDFAVRLTHASLVINYPDITPERVADEFVNSMNYLKLVGLIMHGSGVVEVTDEVPSLEKYREMKREKDSTN